MRQLVLLFNDQLSETLSSLRLAKKDALIVLCELRDEATHVKHHKKKLCLLFSAMRHFAKHLTAKGYSVVYIELTHPMNTQSYDTEVRRLMSLYDSSDILLTKPNDYRLLMMCKQWVRSFSIPVTLLDDDRFIATHDEFNEWAKGKTQCRMEYFYRLMRKKHDILMDEGKPLGGKWNYDSFNRKSAKSGLNVPLPTRYTPDRIVQEVIELVDTEFSDHFGDLTPFHLAVTRPQALAVLDTFIQSRLHYFGEYQDAMLENEPWMYHAHISFYLNCGLLLPMECIKAAEKAYYDDGAPLHAVEGFIRQILGWREYIRGIYWLKMPEYLSMNALDATRALPSFFWTTDTSLNCLNHCLTATKEHAYAHHIQRLMIIGNFSLLCGFHPNDVNEWYHIVYADAYQWVELPNVTGMILFADDGLVASKPYAAGGAYINKMSNYCKNCHYSVKEKTGPTACPFNYLYWNFLIIHREKFKKNPRLAMIYKTLEKMTPETVDKITVSAKQFLRSLD